MLFYSVALPLDYPKDVLGVHNPVLLSVELDLRPRILANDHHVPDTHLHVTHGAGIGKKVAYLRPLIEVKS